MPGGPPPLPSQQAHPGTLAKARTEWDERRTLNGVGMIPPQAISRREIYNVFYLARKHLATVLARTPIITPRTMASRPLGVRGACGNRWMVQSELPISVLFNHQGGHIFPDS
jgi:hypothetical protein